MNTYCDRLAIEIKQGVFNYGNTILLNDLNMTVQIGKITALLGPTGAGKTTVIRLILGRIVLNSGSVAVFGQTPDTSHTDIPGPGVGYMPQKMALFEEFSIAEILSYYGLIYHMKSSDIEKRTQELSELFQLPDKSRKICRLIGSERRRVSIAVTLLHRPKLVILDEPTAGVDPLLRRDIWQHLKQISRDGQTVLITTQHIEEARSADSIAVINNGKILMQGDPEHMLSASGASTRFKNEQEQIVHAKTANPSEARKKVQFDRRRVQALLIKNIRQAMRTISFFAQILLIDISLVVVSIQLAVTHLPRNNPIAIYNADTGSNLSTLFLDSLDKTYIRITEFSSNESAFDSVVKGKNHLSIVIPKGFGDNFKAGLTDGRLASNELLLSTDSTDIAFNLGVHEHIFTALTKFAAIAGQELVGHDLSSYFKRFQLEELFHGDLDYNFAKMVMPGCLILNVWLISLLTSIHQLMRDKLDCSYERTLVAGVTKMEYMVANMLTTMIIAMIPLLETLCTLFYYYHSLTLNSVMTSMALLILVSLMGWSIGYCAGIMSSCYRPTIVMTFHFYILASTVSGTFGPRQSLSPWLYYLTMLVPMTNETTAFYAILCKDWTLAATTVQFGFISSSIYIVISLIAAIQFDKNK